ncbi:hypothetical protein FRIGORI9N_400104 [Frigoribacterium sp. 9N]|nr:hypothetical protein FRIGORI9N_400104 [Frigoribacterium sp. 9N]
MGLSSVLPQGHLTSLSDDAPAGTRTPAAPRSARPSRGTPRLRSSSPLRASNPRGPTALARRPLQGHLTSLRDDAPGGTRTPAAPRSARPSRGTPRLRSSSPSLALVEPLAGLEPLRLRALRARPGALLASADRLRGQLGQRQEGDAECGRHRSQRRDRHARQGAAAVPLPDDQDAADDADEPQDEEGDREHHEEPSGWWERC